MKEYLKQKKKMGKKLYIIRDWCEKMNYCCQVGIERVGGSHIVAVV